MLSFLFFVIAVVLVIGLILISTVFGFIRSVFGFGKRVNPMTDPRSQNHEKPATKSKLIKDNEGEYVDYEELD